VKVKLLSICHFVICEFWFGALKVKGWKSGPSRDNVLIKNKKIGEGEDY
jgi:hypothetical protein